MIGKKAYEVGIKVLVSSNYAGTFAAIASGLTGIGVKADQLTGKFKGMRLAVMGAVGVFAGEKMLMGLGALLQKTKDLSHELTQIRELGRGNDRSIGGIERSAWRAVGKIRGLDITHALHAYRTTYEMLGQKDALAILPLLSQFEVNMHNKTGTWGGSRDLVRAVEQMGRLTNPKTGDVDLDKFKHFLDLAQKVSNVSGGVVNSHTWAQMATTGGPGMMGMDDRGLMTMAILSQYMGGGRVGTAMMSLMQQFAGGTMYTRNAAALEQLGFLGHKGKLDKNTGQLVGGDWGTDGGRVVLSKSARDRLSGYLHDPLGFVKDKLIPALKAHGMNSSDEQVRELFSLLMRQTSQRAVADLLRNLGQAQRSISRVGGAYGLDETTAANNKYDVQQQLDNMSVAYNNFWKAVGENQQFSDALNAMTDSLRHFTDVVRANPEATAAVLKAIGLLAVTLAGVGLYALGAALLPLVGTGGLIVGTAIALGYLAGVNWKSLEGGLQSFVGSVRALINVLQHPLSAWAWEGKTGPGGKFLNPALNASPFQNNLELWKRLHDTTKDNTKSTDQNSKELGNVNDSLQWLGHAIMYLGGGTGAGGGGLINASYTTGGGRAYAGLGRSYSNGYGSVSGAHAGVINPGAVAPIDASHGLINRSTFADVSKNPALIARLATMVNGEVGLNANVHTQRAILEEAFNRWYVREQRAGADLYAGRGGYYAGATFGRRPSAAQIERFKRDVLGPVLGGSNDAMGMTGNASNDPRHNNMVAMHQFMRGTKGYWIDLRTGKPVALPPGYAGGRAEGMFMEGPFRRQLPMMHGGPHWDANDIWSSLGGSAVPPPKTGGDVHIHNHITLDGRTVAKNTMKHIVKQGQGAPHGTRMPDYQGTRPQPGPMLQI